jgi:hypothetical protein
MKKTNTLNVMLVLAILGIHVALLGCAYRTQPLHDERALQRFQQSPNPSNDHSTGYQDRQRLRNETWDTIFYRLVDQQIDLLVTVYDTVFSFR